MQRLLSILLANHLALPSMGAASADSIAVESNFKAGEVIMPLTLIGAGTLGFVEPLKNARYEVRDFLHEWRGDHRTAIDDHLQYVPLGAVYGLSLLGADAKHNYVDRTLELATAYVALGGIVNAIKYTVREPRPDGSANNSFPSGHTATTFMGAELVRIEYGDDSPWYSVGAYTAAITVGVLRVYNNKHWFTDVLHKCHDASLLMQVHAQAHRPRRLRIPCRERQKCSRRHIATVLNIPLSPPPLWQSGRRSSCSFCLSFFVCTSIIQPTTPSGTDYRYKFSNNSSPIT